LTIKTEAIVFPNSEGHNLFGTLHTPPNVVDSYPTIVLLSPGVKMRVGPHRLYNRVTETLNSLGYRVFKFDFWGLGDSEGELDKDLLAEVYNDTETGAFVNDSADALNWLTAQYGLKSFIVGGLCGGAITGILLASDNERVKGLISLGMTVTLAMGAANRLKYATQGDLASLRKGYLQRLLRPKSWLRLLTFQSDFSTISKSLGQLFKQKPAPPNPATVDASEQQDESNANPFFPPAFFKMTRSDRKILLIFSGSDRLFWDFDEKFAQPYARELGEVSQAYDLHVIKDANHVFSFREWEADMLCLVTNWLQANFGQPPNSNSENS
jgi:uncharacterized protein